MPGPALPEAIRTDIPSLTPPSQQGHEDYPAGGVPIKFPANFYNPISSQNFIPMKAVNVQPGQTVTAIKVAVPPQYNGWIMNLFAFSQNNAGQPQNPFTFITPSINGNRIWPFVGTPDPANPNQSNYPLFPSESFTIIVTPVLIRDSNIIQVDVTNTGGAIDLVEIGLLGWIDQTYVPDASANRTG